MKFNRLLFLSPAILLIPSAFAQTQTPLLGIGDSLGEGVQSANAFAESQPNTYLNRFAQQMAVPFQQPLLSTSLFASIFNDNGRSRIDPTAIPADLAVSGATLDNVLNTTASTSPEYDLVLPPYVGLSQIQIVEQVKPKMVIAWAGTDDLISEVLNFSTLNQPDPTPLPTFTSEYQELISRLSATGAQVVVGTIPDLTKIAYLVDNTTLTRYTGTNYNLPAGTLTTLPTMLLLDLGVFGPDILQNPGYILTPTELTALQTQIQTYNQVIRTTAAAAGFPVVDASAIIDDLVSNPITIEGVTITTSFNGGGFSLDGVHPSDTGHAVFANAFIKAANAGYNLNIPVIPLSGLVTIFNNDPFVDFKGTGVVPGRPFTGLLETLAPFFGLSGSGILAKPVSADAFMREYRQAKGVNQNTPWTKSDVIAAVTDMFGIKH